MKTKLPTVEEYLDASALANEYKFQDICAIKVLCSLIETGYLTDALTNPEKEWIKKAWDIAELMAVERGQRR